MENYFKVFNIFPFPLSIKSSNNELIFVNRKYKKFFGLDSRKYDIFTRSSLEYINEMDIQLDKDAMEKNHLKRMIEIIDINGRRRYFYVHKSILYLDSSTAILSMYLDVTKEKEINNRLLEYKRKYNTEVRRHRRALVKKFEDMERLNKALLNLVDDLNESYDKIRQNNEKLTQLNEQLRTFNYAIAHDLRAPIRAIKNYLEFIEEGCSNTLDDSIAFYLQRITKSVKNMETIIDDLKKLGEISEKEILFEDVNLKYLVEEVLSLFEMEIKDSNLKIVTEKLDCVINTDEVILRHILINLISNAIKFRSKKGQSYVRIYSEEDSSSIRIFVEDNGIGISKRDASKIFNPFERLHGQDDYPGFGLGLTLVLNGVTRLKGSVNFKSKVGRGSKFWIELPLKN